MRRIQSRERQGRDLLADVALELPDLKSRLNAFEILAPERVHLQINPRAGGQDTPGTIADPPLPEIVPGTDVTY